MSRLFVLYISKVGTILDIKTQNSYEQNKKIICICNFYFLSLQIRGSAERYQRGIRGATFVLERTLN